MRLPKFALSCAILLGLCLNFSAAAETPRVGLLLKGRTKFWSVVEQGARTAAVRLGVELVVKTPPTESDISTQIQMLNALAKEGVGCIIIAPGNAESLAQPVAAVAARGIKIVVIDSPLNGDSASVFIGPDHRAAGEAAGKLLASLVGPGDQISVFRLAQENTVTTSREDGAIAALKAANAEQVIYSEIYAGNTPDLQAERARLVFAKHPGVTGILASSTPGTLAMLQLLSSRTPPGAVKLVGFGFNLSEEAATALQNGVLHGWIAQLPLQTGRLGVEHALALLSGKTPPPVVHTEFRVITKDSLSDPAVQALLKL